MTHRAEHDAIAEELRSFGALLPRPVADPGLAVAVLARVSALPVPQQSGRVVRQRRRIAIAVLALLLSLLAVPPVRAAIADWFNFAGVVVRHDPSPAPRSAPAAPPLRHRIDLQTAKGLVAFDPLVPAELGSPQGVEVSPDRRVLSMSWAGGSNGALRLDQFDGRLDYTFAKTAPGVEFTTVAGATAIWFNEPHSVVVLDADGTSRTETARLAGHTLIWEHAATTLRLEGDVSLQRAIEIATSARPVP